MSTRDEQVSYEAGRFIASMIEAAKGEPLTENQEDSAIVKWGTTAANLDVLTEVQVTAFQAGLDAYFTEKR